MQQCVYKMHSGMFMNLRSNWWSLD